MNITEFIEAFTPEKLFLETDQVIIRNNHYRVPRQLQALLRNRSREVFSMGMFLGTQAGKRFVPSFQLLDWVSLHTSRKVTLNEKSSWLFVCGRDVFKGGIVEAPDGLRDGDLVLLQNELGECLGVGRWQMSKKVMVQRILDRGDFLRRESGSSHAWSDKKR